MKMTAEQQRIAIAEACGWLLDHINRSAMYYVPNMDCYVGDPLSDLNACREFEIWLLKNHPDLRAVHRRILIECVGPDGFYWMATAAQRCEAFLKTINKWEVQHESIKTKRHNC